MSFPSGNAIPLVYTLDPIIISPSEVAAGIQEGPWPLHLLGFVYLVGSMVLIIRLGHQLLQIAGLVRKYGITRIHNTNIVLTDSDLAPFSIFNMVFISREMFSKPGLKQILEHEKAHIRQYHTLDLFLVELLVVFHWFNPIIWLYKRSFRSLHEYLADRSVLDRGNDLKEYQQLLLMQTFGIRNSAMSNFFNRNLIKNRFIMMTNKKNRRISKSTLFILFPATLIFTFFLSASFTNSVLPDLGTDPYQNNTINSSQTINIPQDDPVFTKVDEMPSFKGGDKALSEYIGGNIKYPENARKNKVEGKVFATFVIEKNGEVSTVKVLRGIGAGCDEETIRVIEEMPKWNPGKLNGKPVRVQFNLPVDFKLDGGKESEKAPSDNTRKGVKQYQKVKNDHKSDGTH
jgi:TonB family protein